MNNSEINFYEITKPAPIITSLETADDFFWWLNDNPQIDGISGYRFERHFQDEGDYRVSRAWYDSTGSYFFTAEYIFKNRRMYNDWIKYINSEYANWLNE